MKAFLAVAAMLATAPALGSPPAKSLPGVSDKETTIPFRDVKQSVRGHGDVIFVQDRTNKWYRIQLNEGCARGTSDASAFIFRHHGASRQIDRFTTVAIGGEMRNCGIRSIRKSEPPPQIDSKSRVTLE